MDFCVKHTSHEYLIVLGQSPDIAISANCNEAKAKEKDLKSLSAFGTGTYDYQNLAIP